VTACPDDDDGHGAVYSTCGCAPGVEDDAPVVEAGEYLLALGAGEPFDSTLTLVPAPRAGPARGARARS
jgi:hypothetical protein